MSSIMADILLKVLGAIFPKSSLDIEDLSIKQFTNSIRFSISVKNDFFLRNTAYKVKCLLSIENFSILEDYLADNTFCSSTLFCSWKPEYDPLEWWVPIISRSDRKESSVESAHLPWWKGGDIIDISYKESAKCHIFDFYYLDENNANKSICSKFNTCSFYVIRVFNYTKPEDRPLLIFKLPMKPTNEITIKFNITITAENILRTRNVSIIIRTTQDLKDYELDFEGINVVKGLDKDKEKQGTDIRKRNEKLYFSYLKTLTSSLKCFPIAPFT